MSTGSRRPAAAAAASASARPSRVESTVCTQSKVVQRGRTLLRCRPPIRCQVAGRAIAARLCSRLLDVVLRRCRSIPASSAADDGGRRQGLRDGDDAHRRRVAARAARRGVDLRPDGGDARDRHRRPGRARRAWSGRPAHESSCRQPERVVPGRSRHAAPIGVLGCRAGDGRGLAVADRRYDAPRRHPGSRARQPRPGLTPLQPAPPAAAREAHRGRAPPRAAGPRPLPATSGRRPRRRRRARDRARPRRCSSAIPDSIWAGPARLDVGRVRRRTGDLAGARDWLDAAADDAPRRRPDRRSSTLSAPRSRTSWATTRRPWSWPRELRDARPRGLVVRRRAGCVERIRAATGRAARSPASASPRRTSDSAEGDAPGRTARGARGPRRRRRRGRRAITRSGSRRVPRGRWARGRRRRPSAWPSPPATPGPTAPARSARPPAGAGTPTTTPARCGSSASWRAASPAAARRPRRSTPSAASSRRPAPTTTRSRPTMRSPSAIRPSRIAGEARWRAGWVRYLAGDYAAAAERFARLAAASERETRVAAEYWEARALENVGDPEAQAKLAHVAEEHPATFYGVLASARLGIAPRPPRPTRSTRERPPFPDALTGAHADPRPALRRARPAPAGATRARCPRARRPRPAALLQAYAAVEAPGPAHPPRPRLASARRGRRYLYPLGYWEVVRPAGRGARARSARWSPRSSGRRACSSRTPSRPPTRTA